MIIRPSRNSSLIKDNLTEEEKILVGSLARIDGSAAISKATGISIPTIRKCAEGRDDYANGADPNRPKINPDLKSKVDELATSMKDKLQNLAHAKIERTLSKLDDEKLDSVTKATDLASIAASLSKVAASFDKHDGPSMIAPIQFNVFRPRQRDEEEYEVITVNE